MKPLGVLDRYILRQWLSIFLVSGLGIPAVAVLINLSERFGPLTSRQVPVRDILLGEVFFYPYQVATLLPAAVLFATVFTLNAMGRRSELTAAKAGGVSFLRLILPMLLLATLAVPANFAIQELAAVSSAHKRELHREKPPSTSQFRTNATFVAANRWVYGASEARREIEQDGQRLAGRLHAVILDSPPIDGVRQVVVGDSATWSPSRQSWTIHRGSQTFVDATTNEILGLARFQTMEMPMLTDPPRVLVDEQKKAEEMRYRELEAYLDQLRRAAAVPGQLEVDFHLKLALPVACIIVALFGAPLAVTNPRAGAALGLAMALGTTLIYLTGTQIMKAVGGKGMITPLLGAWSMNLLFGVLALVLLSRVRS